MTTRLTIALMLLAVGLSRPARAQTSIAASNAPVTTPRSSEYMGLVSWRPGNGDTVTVNPPIFSWWASTNCPDEVGDEQKYAYVFQVGSDSGITSPTVNVSTELNFWNALAPLSVGTWYWRVHYVGTNGATNFTSPVRNFIVPANALTWDRSYILTADFTNRLSVHPRLFLNASNGPAQSTFLTTNLSHQWTFHTAAAVAATNAAWWHDHTAWPTNGTMAGDGAIYGAPADQDGRVAALGAAVQLWAFGADNRWTNASMTGWIVTNYLKFALWYDSCFRVFTDYGNGEEPSQAALLSLGYDWLYPVMTSGQRASAIAVLDHAARVMTESFWYQSNPYLGTFERDYTFAYAGQRNVAWWSPSKFGSSHPNHILLVNGLLGLAGAGESTNCARFLNHTLHFWIARGTSYAGHDTGAYGRVRYYTFAELLRRSLHSNLAAVRSVWPELGITNAALVRTFPEWYSRMTPPGYWEWHGYGSDAGLRGLYTMGAHFQMGRFWALLSGDGRAWQWHQNQLLVTDLSGEDYEWYMLSENAGLWPPPAPETNTLARCYTNEGWVVASTLPPNRVDAFTNGIGVTYRCSPCGSERNHVGMGDGSVEITAYGARMTDLGGYNLDAFGKNAPEAGNGLFVGGYGIAQTAIYDVPGAPVYGKILAFTNGGDWTFWASDLTGFFTNAAHANRYATSVRRSVLLLTNAVVLCDQLTAHTSTTFQWLWPVLENTIRGLTVSNFVYSTTNRAGAVVTNYILHASAGLSVTNHSPVTSNPFTGVSYDDGSDPGQRHSSVWYSSPSGTNWTFVSVIAPQKPGSAAPVVERVNDATVSIDGTTITFNGTAGADYDVQLDGLTDNPDAPDEPPPPESSAPAGVRVILNRVILGH